MQYVFCYNDKELSETYEYLNRLEVFLGKKIVRLNAKAGFDHWLDVFGGYLPSADKEDLNLICPHCVDRLSV